MPIKLEDSEPVARRRINPIHPVLIVGALIFSSLIFLNLDKSVPMKLRLYTNNIRYDNRNIGQDEHYWEERQPLVSESIRFHTQSGASVVCLQEVLYNQLNDILGNLNGHSDAKTWGYYGIGREDGKTKGEFSPIFFKNADWELVSSKTYWLSQTPDKPSIGWDAVLERIVTEVILKSKDTGKKVKVLNTHFDHRGVTARKESVKLIMSKMESGPEPAFLCGDFNTQPTDEPYQILKDSGFTDSRIQGEIYGYNTTFSGFNHNHEDNTIIDYIWAGNGTNWQSYGVVPNYFDIYMSDHRPVIADYLI